jgi:hypothetical protein
MAGSYDDDDDDQDPFDQNGLLRDGRRLRVPMMLRDADSLTPLQRAVAEDAVARRFGLRHAADLHAPGPRYCTDRAGLERKARAYAEMVEDMTNAWRTPAAHHGVTDASARKTNDREVARVHNTGDAKRDAYLDYVADLTSAWQRRR